MKLRVTKNRVAYCLLAALGLLLTGCFQPVDIGETFIEEGTAHLKVSNNSEDDSYVLEGFELRNAEGETVQSWEGLDLAAGKSRDIHTETEGSYTLWYRVKDTWISETIVDFWEGGPVDIALNKSHDFSFKRENFKVVSRDEDNDGLPDIWEAANGFDPEDPADGGTVYVRGNGRDELDNIDELDSQDGAGGPNRVLLGTRDHPYKTLAKAVEKARRGLDDTACTVVVLGTLDWQNGNPPDPDDRIKSESLFALGKTRHPLTIKGEDLTDPAKPGVLRAFPDALKRVLYIGPGADITLLNITITGGKHKGGGIYASGATLTLGKDTTVIGNESYDVNATGAGGIYMERGTLVMEPHSLVTENKAHSAGGVNLVASTFTMKGGKITGNHATRASGGLAADGCPLLEMFDGAEISENTVGKKGSTAGDNAGGVGLVFSTLTMHQGSRITGNKVYSGFGGGLYVTGESTLIMKGGEISNNECIVETGDTTNAGDGGGLNLANKSSLVMEGGSITNNTAVKNGGGIYLTGESSFTMTGGDISKNKTTGDDKSGGGIFIEQSSLFTMAGGSIKDNSTIKGNGVGVYLGTGTFTMTGGDITNNTAAIGSGGGVFLSHGASFTMTGGKIAKNTVEGKGGGIYVRNYTSTDTPPAAVFTMTGGHVYGKDDNDNKNIAGDNAEKKGQAVYVRKSANDTTFDTLDNTITSFPSTP